MKTCLLDLPVYPGDRDGACATSTIVDTYLAERNALQSGEDLKTFVDRWHNLWLLNDDYEKLPDEEKAIADNNISHDQVYALLLRKQEDKLDFGDMNVRIMAHIAVPIAFLQAHRISKHYGIGSDLAMVRLYLDPYPQYDDALRCGNGDTRPKMVEEVMDK